MNVSLIESTGLVTKLLTYIYSGLSYGTTSGSDIRPCIKMDNTQVSVLHI